MNRERATLLAAILGSGIVFLDGTVVNVALPAIRDDLDAGLAAQQWVVEGFLLTLSALLLAGGSLGDLLGRRRIFVLGTAAFGVASLGCAVAPDPVTLVAARAVQGAAGALLVPSTLALIMDTFPQDRRAAAIGSWTAWTGVAMVIGPMLGGALVDEASWRWIFAINVPFVAGVLWLARYLRPDEPRAHARVDWAGAALAALGLGGVVFGLIEQPRDGWGAPVVWVPLAAGLAFLAAFVWWERRTAAPMLPPGLFAVRNFAVGNLATLGIYAGLGGGFFLLVIHLQQVAGYSAFEAGIATLPVTVIMLLASKRFGALADRLGPRLFMGLGPLVAAAGFFMLLGLDADVDYVGELLPGVLVFGVGLAATVAPLTAAVLAAASGEHAGVASGVNNAVARVAALLAIAAVGAVAATAFADTVRERGGGGERALSQPMVVQDDPQLRAITRDAAVDGFRWGIGLAGALVLAGGIVALVGIVNPRRDAPVAVGEPAVASAHGPPSRP